MISLIQSALVTPMQCGALGGCMPPRSDDSNSSEARRDYLLSGIVWNITHHVPSQRRERGDH